MKKVTQAESKDIWALLLNQNDGRENLGKRCFGLHYLRLFNHRTAILLPGLLNEEERVLSSGHRELLAVTRTNEDCLMKRKESYHLDTGSCLTLLEPWNTINKPA